MATALHLSSDAVDFAICYAATCTPVLNKLWDGSRLQVELEVLFFQLHLLPICGGAWRLVMRTLCGRTGYEGSIVAWTGTWSK